MQKLSSPRSLFIALVWAAVLSCPLVLSQFCGPENFRGHFSWKGQPYPAVIITIGFFVLVLIFFILSRVTGRTRVFRSWSFFSFIGVLITSMLLGWVLLFISFTALIKIYRPPTLWQDAANCSFIDLTTLYSDMTYIHDKCSCEREKL
jgi:hypothetical protein